MKKIFAFFWENENFRRLIFKGRKKNFYFFEEIPRV